MKNITGQKIAAKRRRQHGKEKAAWKGHTQGGDAPTVLSIERTHRGGDAPTM